MLLDNEIADFGLESSRTATEVKDELALIKFNFLITILGNNANELKHILPIFKGYIPPVEERIGIIGDIWILIDLDGATS